MFVRVEEWLANNISSWCNDWSKCFGKSAVRHGVHRYEVNMVISRGFIRFKLFVTKERTCLIVHKRKVSERVSGVDQSELANLHAFHVI